MSRRLEEVRCPECGTANTIRSKFCASCGLVIVSRNKEPGAVPEAGDAPPVRSRKRRKPDKSEGREIELQLGRARETLKHLRLLFGIFGVFCLLPTGLILLAALSTEKELADALLLPAIVSVVFTAFLLAGVFFVFAQPLFFTITAACLATLLAILLGVGQSWIWFALFVLIALGSWCSLPLVLNIVRLKRDYPALITSEKLKSRESRDVGTSAARVRSVERTARHRQGAMRTYAIVGGVVLIGVATILTIKFWPAKTTAYASNSTVKKELSAEEKMRVTSLFKPALRRFEDTWKSSSQPGLAAMGSTEFHDRWWSRVQSGLRKRDWHEKFPPIAIEKEFDNTSVTENEVWFDIVPKGTLKTSWVFEDDVWKIRKITFAYTR